MNFYLLTYLIHQLLLNFSSIMNNFPDKEKVRWQLACHCIQYLPKRGDLNGRIQKKRRKIIRSIRFPRYKQKKKKKYNDNNNKKERFVRNRSANLSPTHARIHTYTCLLFFFHYYFFFFFVHSVYRDELKNEAAKMEKRQKCDTVDGAG